MVRFHWYLDSDTVTFNKEEVLEFYESGRQPKRMVRHTGKIP